MDKQFESLVRNSQDLIYYCDTRGHFTFVNPAAARVMKYGEQELIGRHFLTLIRPDYQAIAAAHYTKQFSERIPTSYFEFPAIAKTGETVWFGQHVQLVFTDEVVVAVHAIARDITRQKDAEERLRQSESRYRSLIHGAAYGIFRTNIEGRILDANKALATMLGYESAEELSSMNVATFYKFKEDRIALLERYGRGGAAASTDVTWVRKDGSEIEVHLSARVVQNEDGSVGFEGIAEDITERRLLEDQLRRAQKMEAIGRLARGVAHDFNNVLAAILGTADLMTFQLKKGDPVREDAEEIRKAAERGAALTKQLLTFSRSQALEPKVLDLNVVVPTFTQMLQRLAGSSSVSVKVASEPAHVRVEPGQLEQVLLNLVVNARDAMPEGGPIDIEISTLVLGEKGSPYPGLAAGPYVQLAVRDTGVGIDPDVQPHIFEPFVTTKGPAKGTGLGLSIVYGVARDAGGLVTFTTAPNKGSTFLVVLPRVTPG
jgi:PAS domain S-box-containing protein